MKTEGEKERKFVEAILAIGRQVKWLTVTADDLIANKAQIAEELMIMRLAIGQATFLVVAMTQKGFLAFGTDEMLDVPVLAQRCDDTLLNRTTACTANGDAHFVVTSQAIQLVHVIGSEARTALHFASS